MPNQKVEKAALVTTMSQFSPLPAVWQQQPKMAKISTKPTSSQIDRQMVGGILRVRVYTASKCPPLLCCGVLCSIPSCCVVLCYLMLCCVLLCFAVFCVVVLCFVTQHNTTQHTTTPHNTTRHNTPQHNAARVLVLPQREHMGVRSGWGCVNTIQRGGGVIFTSMLGGCVNMPIALGLQTFPLTTHIVGCTTSTLFPIVSTHMHIPSPVGIKAVTIRALLSTLLLGDTNSNAPPPTDSMRPQMRYGDISFQFPRAFWTAFFLATCDKKFPKDEDTGPFLNNGSPNLWVPFSWLPHLVRSTSKNAPVFSLWEAK